MCMVCLLHLFATRVRHSQSRMEQPLLKNSQISEIPDKLFSTQQLHGYGNLFKETSLEEIDTLFQEYEIRNQKNIASDAKEILNDHDSTLILNYVIPEKN